jgi:hypothetical protein
MISLIRIEDPSLGVIGQLKVEELFKLPLDGRVVDGKGHLHPMVKVPLHEIRRREVESGFAPLDKPEDASVFQEPVYD